MKKIITTNAMQQNGVTAIFIWKQCQKVHNIVESAVQNIQRMYLDVRWESRFWIVMVIFKIP